MITDIPGRLTPIPKKVSLPSSIELKQRLTTDSPPELVTLIYDLDPASDVWFDTGTGLKKRVEIQATVDTKGDVPQTFKLVRDRGQRVVQLEMKEQIRDSKGLELHDNCMVRVGP